MKERDPRIEGLLATLKEQERACLRRWHDFSQWLASRGRGGRPLPPPLILAASAESAAMKHRRLGEQLEWAEDNKLLEDALRYIEGVGEEGWEPCSREKWMRSFYPD